MEKRSSEHHEVVTMGFDEKNDIENVKIDQREPVDEAWLAAEKRLVRKLDMTLIPIVWVLYLFNYLDRNNIA